MRSLLILLTSLLFSINIRAEESKVKATVDGYEYLIGDHIKLDFEAIIPNNWKVVFPALSDTIDSFEIINLSKIDTLFSNQSTSTTYKQRVLLTQFDSGRYEIPRFTFVVDPGKEELGQFIPKKTNPIPISVNSVSIDTTKGFKDIKANLEPEFSIWEYKSEIYVGLGVLVLLLMLAIFWKKIFKKNDTKEKEVNFDPSIEPHVLALGSLKNLKQKKLWQDGKTKEYYSILTDIIRLYVKRCFDIHAEEMTSDEILEAFANSRYSNIDIKDLKEIFTISDMVKFAKAKPISDENELVINLAEGFINKTISYSISIMKQDIKESYSEGGGANV